MALGEKFIKELEQLINRHSVDTELETPDFLLAKLLTKTLQTYQTANQERDSWFQRSDSELKKAPNLKPTKKVSYWVTKSSWAVAPLVGTIISLEDGTYEILDVAGNGHDQFNMHYTLEVREL